MASFRKGLSDPISFGFRLPVLLNSGPARIKLIEELGSDWDGLESPQREPILYRRNVLLINTTN